MIYENPTRLRTGMHASFAGKDFRLVGRSVLGVDINGETYYWNEFNLQAKSGESATLVYEDTERGGEWRLFTEFEPDFSLTAADAATKQVGDQLNLTGIDVQVTLVQASRVYYVEGSPPEGEMTGSEANYFNAEAGNVMQVVSWTGEEVEYYNGLTLSTDAVDTAFNLPRQLPAKMFSTLGGTSSWSGSGSDNDLGAGKFFFWALITLFFFIFTFGRDFSCSRNYESSPVTRISAAPPPLTVGARGSWDGKNYQVTAHAVVEIAQVGMIYERHEYELADESNASSLLVCGEKPDAKEWWLYAPLAPFSPPTPQQAAAQKVGDVVSVDAFTVTIHDVFQSTLKRVENVAPTTWHQGDVQYGYTAGPEYSSLLVRWDQQTIGFFHGKNLPAGKFTAAFSLTNSP